MTLSDTETTIGLVVDHDPAVWLRGPVGPTREQWLQGAYAAVAADFGVRPETTEAGYLRELLVRFVDADLRCDLRFLLLRALVDLPITVRLSGFVGAPADTVGKALTDLDPDATYYDQEPRVETIDAERGLRRSIAFRMDPEGITSSVRYHRRVDEWDADLVVACAGADMKATALGLPLLDDLARAAWFVDAEGERR